MSRATRGKSLVIGAGEFPCSHLTRQLVTKDVDVRVMLRHRGSSPFTVAGLNMATSTSPLDHDSAERESCWEPAPVVEAIRSAAGFFIDQRDFVADPVRRQDGGVPR